MPINMDLWQDEIDQVERGQTLRFNHNDCPAGQDYKRRLYITRPAGSPGAVVAYCHNCQESGFTRSGIARYRDFEKKKAPEDVPTDFRMPLGLERNPDNWPTAAHSWRVQKGLSKKMCHEACIQYDPTTHRIYLPMYRLAKHNGYPYEEKDLLGFQLRHIEGSGPKYYTALKHKDTKPYTRLGPKQHEFLVLVEDLASGLVLSDACHDMDVSVLVNYGVKITPEILAQNNNCDRQMVWLDNDSQHVKEVAQVIARTWAMLSPKPTHVVEYCIDPKLYSCEQLRATVNGWRKNI